MSEEQQPLDELIDFSPGILSDDDIAHFEEDVPTKKSEEQEKPKLKLDYESGTYANHAVLPDQLEKYPETVKFGPPQVSIFNLQDPADLDKYNSLLRDTHPETSPKTVIIDCRVNKNYVAMVTYKNLQYLIPG